MPEREPIVTPLTTPDGALYATRRTLTPSTPDVRIYDYGDTVADRYTVIFPDGDCLGIGTTGNVPNGYCEHVGSIHETGCAAVHEGPHLGARVDLADVPEPVRAAIVAEWRRWYS